MSQAKENPRKDAGQQQQQGQTPATPQQTGGPAPQPIFRDWAAL